jgi:hypothetical protein
MRCLRLIKEKRKNVESSCFFVEMLITCKLKQIEGEQKCEKFANTLG